ncbi:hypothetical protein BCIN_07g05990 [Botrytis cinerea B05.10]|uniref:Uncharacterized protein n=1 Tax=Botryotinia fuckeliana (strain B05.10) TaxID=332648 RepID=A0A384JND3_BOTFB|nr:hypothetical protein BCIN_07g05990 [Botrytis cinerea B05.10]ATZ52088.1 hypothetical protein BCIN_07g05990 [Botrytis cinerea B05.10]
MPSNNRPSRNRKMPERFNSPSVQIETSTHSQTVATVPSTPPPSTPNHASSSSPSSAASTPTPLIRSGGIQWRKNLRATLPAATEVQHLSAQHRQESEASVVEAQANSIPEPRREVGEISVHKPEDEYDVDSPYFGLEHTPEWDDLGIDIDDQSQGRWYPPGLMAPPAYNSLSPAARIMLFHEVTKKMPFKNLVAYLNVTDDQLDNFVELHNSEIMRYIKEEELERSVEARMSEIRRRENRLVTSEEFDLMLYEEVDSKLPPTVLDSPISLLEIGKAIAFLQTCYGSQIPGNHLNNGLRLNNVVLSLSEFNEIIEEMGKYHWLGESHYYDFNHDLGLAEYIDEINRVNSVQESVSSAQEAEKPAKQPIGRPKKRGKQFGNKPLRNKAELLKMVLSSKVQQMDSGEDEAAKNAEGGAVDKGKRKML